jgi:hypothetical protein
VWCRRTRELRNVCDVARSDRLIWACRRAPEAGAARTLAGSVQTDQINYTRSALCAANQMFSNNRNTRAMLGDPRQGVGTPADVSAAGAGPITRDAGGRPNSTVVRHRGPAQIARRRALPATTGVRATTSRPLRLRTALQS